MANPDEVRLDMLVRQHHPDRPVSRRCFRNSRSSSSAPENDRQRAGSPRWNNSASSTLSDCTVFNTSHSDQIFNVKQTIAFLSQGTTLLPGTIILTGTPKGVGFVRKPPVYLKNGDIVQVWIGSGIGTLVNPVVEEREYSLSTKL
jgi:2-keto-4-pentenoate hydratase/2-oxohepta-3-ene-1,7-dioic acid hydratase in catechol pathway